jgi:acetate CoA/acetoacetate CoA-transferase alpha subunit
LSKLVGVDEALDHIRSGMTVMLGGFFWSGSPFSLIRALTARAGRLEGLTLISNDAGSAMGHPESYGNDLIATGMFDKCVASFIGHNHAAMKKIADGSLDLEMIPMGTLAERIRIGGSGIGGFLTPTGVGAVVAEGKQTIELDGETYLLERPLKADIALIYGTRADENGNVQTFGTARSFNAVMAAAADYVVVEAREIVKPGEIDPNDVFIAAPYVDAIVRAKESDYTLVW